MDNYKQALDKAVEYIMNSAEDYCLLCRNKKVCDEQYATLDAQGIAYTPDRNICKDSVKQYFLKQAEDKND